MSTGFVGVKLDRKIISAYIDIRENRIPVRTSGATYPLVDLVDVCAMVKEKDGRGSVVCDAFRTHMTLYLYSVLLPRASKSTCQRPH